MQWKKYCQLNKNCFIDLTNNFFVGQNSLNLTIVRYFSDLITGKRLGNNQQCFSFICILYIFPFILLKDIFSIN